MRASGIVESGRGFGLSDHVCWAYADDDGFLVPGLDWLTEGRTLGQRLVYVADRTFEQMRDDIAGRPELVTAQRDGALLLQPLVAIYPGGGPVDPEHQREVYAAATEGAMDDGFAGLRVLAEVSLLVADPAACSEHVRWEQLADHYMADRPLAAFCAYDRRVVGEDVLAAIACVHPARHDAEASTFALFFDDGEVRLDGEVDHFQAPLLDRTLWTLPAVGPIVLDVSESSFVDGAAITVLAGHVRRRRAHGDTVVVRGGSPLFCRIWELLGCPEALAA